MGARTFEAASVIRGAGPARDSTTHILWRYALGAAMCTSISVLSHAQAATTTGDGRTALNPSNRMTELATVDVPRRPTAVRTTAENDSIRPFRFRASDEELADLRRRILATRLPEKETVSDHSQGVPLALMQELARHWATDYDWRKVEAKLNSYPQFITNIDGLDIHFVHVRSKHPDALPLVVNHGWPGSIVEQLKIIDPLVNPTAYGGTAADAFHVVIPSMPGYGFSGKPTTTGWGPERMARAWDVLMKRLGYARYVAQGGDWGAIVVDQMGLQAPAGLLAIHTNLPGIVPEDVHKPLLAGEPPPSGLSAEERRAYEQLDKTLKERVAYARYMAARPQTLYGIADSPVGLAAWLLDHDDRGGQPAAAVVSALGRPRSATGELTRDEILDNITLFWLTNTGVSASRLYSEYRGGYWNAKGVSIPVAVSVFPGEQYEAPRSWTERAYPKLVYYNKVDRGGHFAAWEQPMLFASELRAGFRSVRGTQTSARKANTSTGEAELRAAIATFRTALNGGDSATFFGLLAPDLEVLAPGAHPIRGTDARESFRPLFTQVKPDIGPFTNEEITVSGDIAIQRHSYRLSTTPMAGGPVTTVNGSGLHVWRRAPDGRWQIVKDIWTTPPAS
jgi:ketosteroid isomerase-like protein/pimeloyl-ACP methyl ester carboxylesterase